MTKSSMWYLAVQYSDWWRDLGPRVWGFFPSCLS